MPPSLLDDAFDVIPSLVFVMDRDVRIHAANSAAMRLAGTLDQAEVMLRRGGDVLKCVNSTLSPGGCGCADACKTCVLRSSTGRSLDSRSVVRGRTRFQQIDRAGSRDSFFLVTASPFESGGEERVLLCLDDLGEQLKVRGVLPYCAGCHRIRNERNEWEDAQHYVSQNLALDPSHGFCEPCVDRLYPG